MSKAKTFEHVLKMILLPQHDILKDVDVNIMGGTMDVHFYVVAYTVKEKIDMSLVQEIQSETITLFNMLGEPKGSDVTVFFYDTRGNYAL
jgi:hypothetical protein